MNNLLRQSLNLNQVRDRDDVVAIDWEKETVGILIDSNRHQELLWAETAIPGRLGELLPNKGNAEADFKELCDRKDWEKVLGLVALDMPLTEEELGRRRYRIENRYINLGPRWGIARTLYEDLMTDHQLGEWKRVTRAIKLYDSKDVNKIYGKSKRLSDLMKKHGPLLSKQWMLFVNVEQFGGYLHEVENTEFRKEVLGWVTGDSMHRGVEAVLPDGRLLMSESAFLKDLEEGMEKFLGTSTNMQHANDYSQTLEEFVGDPGSWARSGSSSSKMSVSYIDKNKRVKKVRKNKWGLAIGEDHGQIKARMMLSSEEDVKQTNKVIQKRELGKVRAVVSSDDNTYLRMSYISNWLEKVLQGNELSMLYMSRTQQESFWEDARHSTMRDSIKLPLDQSHFDWQQNGRMIKRAMDVLERFIKLSVPKGSQLSNDLLEMMQRVTTALTSPLGTVELEGEKIGIEKGVMSGWKWTAMLDTLFNYAEFHAVVKSCERLGLKVHVLNSNFQGDDVYLELADWQSAVNLVEGYRLLGFEINQSKFFMSVFRNEYLREVVSENEKSGYPARAIGAVLWRNPIKRDPKKGQLRANEQLAMWNTLATRGLDSGKVRAHMFQDIQQGNGGLKSDVLSMLLQTPKSFGGLGLDTQRERAKYTIVPGTVTKRTVLRVNREWGLSSERRRWLQLGVDIEDKEILNSLKQNVETPEVKETEQNFEIRVSGTKRPKTANVSRVRLGTGGDKYLRAYPEAHLPSTTSRIILEKLLREKEYDKIRDIWLSKELLVLSEKIESNGGRALWISWLKGDLPYQPPVVWEDDGLLTGKWFNLAAGPTWMSVVGLNHMNMESARLSGAGVEEFVREKVKEEKNAEKERYLNFVASRKNRFIL